MTYWPRKIIMEGVRRRIEKRVRKVARKPVVKVKPAPKQLEARP